jgi:hypothetical protein
MTKKNTFWYALVAMFMAVSFQAPAVADIVSTDQILMEAKSDAKRAELGTLMQRSDVAQQLVRMGVDVADAQLRIDSMSDAELAAVYDKMDLMPAGEGALEVVIAIVVIFLLLDMAGVTDVFPGV